jgi:adenylate cyclase
LTQRIREQAGEKVKVEINHMFNKAQETTAVFQRYLDTNLNNSRSLKNDRQQFDSLAWMQYASVEANKDFFNSINFIFKEGPVVAWEILEGEWTYYESTWDNTFNIYSMNKTTLRPNGPPFSIPNFDATINIPTYQPAVQQASPDTGMFFPVSPHVSLPDKAVSSTARPYVYNGQILGTINVVFFVESIKNMVTETNPSTKGHIVVMQEDMVIVATSIDDDRVTITKPCGSNNTFIQQLCSRINSKKGFDGFGKFQDLAGMRVMKQSVEFPGLKLYLFVGIPDSEFFKGVVKQTYTTIWVSGLVLLAAFILSLLITFSFLSTLTTLAKAFSRIRMLDVNNKAVDKVAKGNSIIYEVRELQDNFRSMLVALRSIKKYVPSQVVKNILSSGQEAELALVESYCTVLFFDIANFTSLAELLVPVQLLDIMADVFDNSSSIIQDHMGIIDKYVGDCIMAVWNSPRQVEHHELQAVLAAIKIQNALDNNNIKLDDKGLPRIGGRIGIHTSKVLAGNFGSKDRFSYTVMGDGVNLASRLEGVNKTYQTKILISEQTYQGASLSLVKLCQENEDYGAMVYRRVEKAAVKGKAQSVMCYEPLAIGNTVLSCKNIHNSDLQRYEQGMDLFITGHFKDALHEFECISQRDAVTEIKIQQCQHYIESGTPNGWDGTVEMTTK